MKPYNPSKTQPRPDPSDCPDPVLERPSRLKKWSHDLVSILNQEKEAVFRDFRFGPGALTEADLFRTCQKITGCGSVVELRAAIDRNTGEMSPAQIHAANFCGQHTVCPFCAGRVQDRRGARFKDPIVTAARVYKYAYMITATMPPALTWREDLDQLVGAWKDFRRLGQRRKRVRTELVDGERRKVVSWTRDPGEFGKVRAGLAKVELKRGADSGLPHCHYHALVFTDTQLDFRVWSKEEKLKPAAERIPLYRIPVRLVDQVLKPAGPWRYVRRPARTWVAASKLTYEWSKVTGFRARSFDVKPIKYLERDRNAGVSYEESVFRQSKEVLKYATKFDSAPAKGQEKLFAQDFVGIKDATYCRRLFHTYGDFYGVPGSDFIGGGPHISSRPIIFETRWRTSKYSPLMERDRPVFANSDKSEANSLRITTLNRVQGGVRRIRTAIVAAKNRYRAGDGLMPAELVYKEYLEDGGFKEHHKLLELPAYVVAAPADWNTWARWIDEAMTAGRATYAAAREALDLDSRETFIGTKEERAAMEDRIRQWRRRAPDYADFVTRCFMEVLAPSPAPP